MSQYTLEMHPRTTAQSTKPGNGSSWNGETALLQFTILADHGVSGAQSVMDSHSFTTETRGCTPRRRNVYKRPMCLKWIHLNIESLRSESARYLGTSRERRGAHERAP